MRPASTSRCWRRAGIPREERAVYRRLVEGRRTDGLIVARTRLDDQRIRYLAEAQLSLRRDRPHRDAARLCACRRRRRERVPRRDRAADRAWAPAHRIRRGARRVHLRQAAASAAGPAPWRRQGSRHDAVIESQLTEFGGLAAARALLARDAAADRAALRDRPDGDRRHARREGAGLVVGRDVSVIGHDNISAAAFTEPAPDHDGAVDGRTWERASPTC